MSVPEQREEPRSSVKLSETAKGDVRIELKVYAGDTKADVDQALTIAQNTYLAAAAWLKNLEVRAA